MSDKSKHPTGKKAMLVFFDLADHRALRVAAAENDMPMSKFVVQAVLDALRKRRVERDREKR